MAVDECHSPALCDRNCNPHSPIPPRHWSAAYVLRITHSSGCCKYIHSDSDRQMHQHLGRSNVPGNKWSGCCNTTVHVAQIELTDTVPRSHLFALAKDLELLETEYTTDQSTVQFLTENHEPNEASDGPGTERTASVAGKHKSSHGANSADCCSREEKVLICNAMFDTLKDILWLGHTSRKNGAGSIQLQCCDNKSPGSAWQRNCGM